MIHQINRHSPSALIGKKVYENMLSEALRLMRVFHDLKQNELAGKLGISNSHLSEIEKGKKIPSMEVLKSYSDQFSLPISAIMLFSEQLPNARLGEKVRARIAQKAIDMLKFVEKNTDG